MVKIPDFTAHNYQIISELGRNREGGRITWQAQELNTKKTVVIKQFCFAATDSNWSDLRNYEQEIKILKNLAHPGIPKYLKSFHTENGFCLIQEYKAAASLGQPRTFTPQDVKNIAVKLLEILIYLQVKLPPVLHRDIKPENILVDQELNVYLVDFGLATLGTKKMSVSSMFKGTPGFIAPEQIIRPSLASDLYGLGVTLICLLTGIESVDIQDLASEDDPYKLEFKELLPQLSLPFLNWLEKMISPQLNLRFKNAQEALESLLPLDLIRTPQPKLDKLSLDLYGGRFGETLRATITVTNEIPETNLQGEWSVLPHDSDPPHTSDRHVWISFLPKKISRNKLKCQVFFDTSKLISNQVYHREIVLKTNGIPDSLYVKVKLHTAPLAITLRQPGYLSLGRFFFLLIPTIITGLGAAATAMVIMAANTLVNAVLGGVAVICSVALPWAGLMAVTLALGGVGAGVGVVYLAVGMTVVAAVVGAGVIAGVEIGICTGAIAGLGAGWVLDFLMKTFRDRGLHHSVGVGSLILTTAIALLLGSSLIIDLQPIILLGLYITLTPLIVFLLYPNFQRARLRAKYKQAERETLIKP